MVSGYWLLNCEFVKLLKSIVQMSNNIKTHEDLEVWQQCRNLRKSIWILCKTFPEDEKNAFAIK